MSPESPAAAKVQARALICPNCGGAVQLRGLGRALTVVCGNCQSILDPNTPSLTILQKASQKVQRIEPLIPLGTRGKLRGDLYEVIGFQVRSITYEGVRYPWAEYVLFNPYKGFRYLTEYRGHWNDVKPLDHLPEPHTSRAGNKGVKLLGQRYKLFQSATATTDFVLGEFPWRAMVGERTEVEDYVNAPLVVSSEKSGSEVTWSLGEYTTGRDIWQHFNLPGQAPPTQGVYLNQPSPYTGRALSIWQLFVLFVAMLFVVSLLLVFTARREQVFRSQYHYQSGTPGALVTDIFELKGRTSNVEITLNTDLNQDWAFFNFALVNEQTGTGYVFGREVGYFYGRDSDGSWTEGDTTDRAVIPSVPPGRYYLRIEPEMETMPHPNGLPHGVNYVVTVRRDVPTATWFFVALLLLIVPPIFVGYRTFAFEQARWSESDSGALPM